MLTAGRAAALVCGLTLAAHTPTEAPGRPLERPGAPARRHAPVRVSGRIHTEDRRQLVSGTVIMMQVRGGALVAIGSRDVLIAPDGSFVFREVEPGRYEIRARGDIDPKGTMVFGSVAVEVTDRNVENIDLILRPGATVDGTVVFEGSRRPKPASLTGIRVRAPLADGTPFGDSVTGDLRPDGGFRIRGIRTGTHAITIEGLPEPWTIKRVLAGGLDISDSTIEASGQPLGGVRITVSDVASEVSGVVRDERGAPAEAAIVVVTPVAEQYWTPTSRRVGTARTDGTGRYRLRGLPDGEYRAAATLEIDEREARTNAILRGVSESGAPLTLDETRPHVLDLTLVPAAALRRTPAR